MVLVSVCLTVTVVLVCVFVFSASVYVNVLLVYIRGVLLNSTGLFVCVCKYTKRHREKEIYIDLYL